MAQIKHRVWIKESPTADPVLKRLDPTADILKISRTGALTDPEIIRIVPYGREVTSQSLLNAVSDLVDNDYKINNEIVATNEIISEGIFDIPKSSLSSTEIEELEILQEKLDTNPPLSEEEQIRYDYLIRLKYGYKFDMIIEDLTITVSPGKFKVNEEHGSNVYHIKEVSEFEIENITTDDHYRLDLIKAVFRDTEGEVTPPYLTYEYGTEETTPSPSHVITSRELTPTYGTFPIWSVLCKESGGETTIIRTTRVAPWVGLRALLEIKNMTPHEIVEPETLLTYYSVHHLKDLALRDFNGNLLDPDYGEGTIIEELEGPKYLIDVDWIAPTLQGVPDNFEPLKRGANNTIPFRLTDLYNEYISYNSVEFRTFSVAMKETVVDPADREGLELHVYSADPYCNASKVKEFEAVITEYDLDSGDLQISKTNTDPPDLPLNSVAFKIEGDTDDLVFTLDENSDTQTSPSPIAGDFVFVSYGKGSCQIAELLAIHCFKADPTKKMNVLVTKPLKIALDDLGGYTGSPRIMIFKSATETLVGDQIKDQYGDYTDWYNALSTSDKAAIDLAYPFSSHTGISRLPWDSGDTRADLGLFYDSGSSEILDLTYRRLDMPMKIRLKLNKWYFIKMQVFQKEEPYDTYYDPGKPQIAYPNPIPPEADAEDVFCGWYETVYIKNFGRYTEENEEGERIVKISDLYGDIQETNTSRIGDGKPAYWKLVAKNLDNEVLEAPPAASGNIGTCYFDVVRGKMIFAPGETPDSLKITCIIDNVLHGASDTENLLHLESESEVITLAAKLAEITQDINELEILLGARIMEYRGPNSRLLKYDDFQYHLLDENTIQLGTKVYGCDADGVALPREIMEQRYPISRLQSGMTNAWSYAQANGTMTVNIFEDLNRERTDIKELLIQVTDDGAELYLDEEAPDGKFEFTVTAPAHLLGKVSYKRFGFRLCDFYGNKVLDLGITGSVSSEWTDNVYLALHDDEHTSYIPTGESKGEIWGGGAATEWALKVPKTRVEEIYDNFNRKGSKVAIGGYNDVLFDAAFDEADSAIVLDDEKDYYIKVNGSELKVFTATSGEKTYGQVIAAINSVLTGMTATYEPQEGADSRIRITHDTPGVGNDVEITTPGTAEDLFGSMTDYLSIDADVPGADGTFSAEEAQDKMWIYFELDDAIELSEGDYHFHIFVKYRDANTTTPKLMQYDENAWLESEPEMEPLGEGDPLWERLIKYYYRPLKYTGGGTYTGGYLVNEAVPKLITLAEDPLIESRDGRSTTTEDEINLALATTDERYNMTPDWGIVDVMPAVLGTLDAWENWKYFSYVGIDISNGRIKTPSTWPTGYTLDWDDEQRFAEFNMRWPLSSLDTKSFGDADDPGVSLHDKRYDLIRTKDEAVTFIDDALKRARILSRSVGIDWTTSVNYKINDIVIVDNKFYKCLEDHTSDATSFDNDLFKWVICGYHGAVVIQNFTATLDQTEFVLDFAPLGPEYLDIALDGAVQHGGYSLVDKTITFDNPCEEGLKVRCKYEYNIHADPGAVIDSQVIVAEAAQTVFDFTNLLYVPIGQKYCILTIDGTIVDDDAYSFTDDKEITFGPDPSFAGGELVKLKIFHSLNIYSQEEIQISDTGALYFGPKDVDGTWRIIRDGDDLVFERRESGSYDEKSRITAIEP